MTQYCSKGKEWLLELKRAEWLGQYDEELVRGIVGEMNDIQSRISLQTSSFNAGALSTAPREIRVSSKYLFECFNRNSLYLNAGINHRLEQVRRMRWEAGPVLPSFLDKDVLSSREREYFARYNDIITDYIEEVGIDVASYSEPPKDLQIEIRVLEDCGEVLTENGPMRLAKNSIVFVRRSAVESFIKEGKVEHILPDGEC